MQSEQNFRDGCTIRGNSSKTEYPSHNGNRAKTIAPVTSQLLGSWLPGARTVSPHSQVVVNQLRCVEPVPNQRHHARRIGNSKASLTPPLTKTSCSPFGRRNCGRMVHKLRYAMAALAGQRRTRKVSGRPDPTWSSTKWSSRPATPARGLNHPSLPRAALIQPMLRSHTAPFNLSGNLSAASLCTDATRMSGGRTFFP